MKKISTVAVKQNRSFSEQKLTIGVDRGDRSSWYCVLDAAGSVLLEQRLSTTPKAMKEGFGAMPHSRIVWETGMHSPWVSRWLSELGHEMIVAHARNVRLIGESRKKDDRLDAQTLARLARIDPKLLCPVQHRSARAQADLTVIRARAGLVRARTALVNPTGGLAKSYGERLRGCNVRNMNPEKAQGLSPELRTALEPLLAGIESLSERIRECNEGMERRARESYPQVAQQKPVKGGGHIDRADLPADAGRRASFSQEPGCGLLPGIAAGTEKLGPERAANAHLQGRRSVSANAAGAGSAPPPGGRLEPTAICAAGV
jgi:transposase